MVSKNNNLAFALVKKHTSFHSVGYTSLGGYPSIGYGTIKDVSQKKEKISRVEADKLLIKDVQSLERFISRVFPNQFTEKQTAALVSYAHSVGKENFRNSPLFLQLKNKDYTNLAECFFDPTFPTAFSRNNKFLKLWLRRREEYKLFTEEKHDPLGEDLEAYEKTDIIENSGSNPPCKEESSDKVEDVLSQVTDRLTKYELYYKKFLDIMDIIRKNKASLVGVLGLANIEKIVAFFKSKFYYSEQLINFLAICLIIWFIIYKTRQKK